VLESLPIRWLTAEWLRPGCPRSAGAEATTSVPRRKPIVATALDTCRRLIMVAETARCLRLDDRGSGQLAEDKGLIFAGAGHRL